MKYLVSIRKKILFIAGMSLLISIAAGCGRFQSMNYHGNTRAEIQAENPTDSQTDVLKSTPRIKPVNTTVRKPSSIPTITPMNIPTFSPTAIPTKVATSTPIGSQPETETAVTASINYNVNPGFPLHYEEYLSADIIAEIEIIEEVSREEARKLVSQEWEIEWLDSFYWADLKDSFYGVSVNERILITQASSKYWQYPGDPPFKVGERHVLFLSRSIFSKSEDVYFIIGNIAGTFDVYEEDGEKVVKRREERFEDYKNIELELMAKDVDEAKKIDETLKYSQKFKFSDFKNRVKEDLMKYRKMDKGGK